MATPTIKTKIQLDGESEYKKSISDINAKLNELNSEMKKTEAQYANNANSAEALRAKQEVLNKQIEAQKEKIKTLQEVVKKASEAYGENDTRTLKWKTSLNKAEEELFKMQHKLDDTTDALGKFGDKQEETNQKGVGFDTLLSTISDKLGISIPSSATKAVSGLGQIDAKTAACVAGFVALAAAVAEVEKKLIEMTKESAKWADDLNTQAKVAGIATEQLQEYAYAADLIDVSADTITGAQTRLIRSMQSAQEGTESAMEAFNKLNISVTNADGSLRDADEVFWEAIDRLGQMTNKTEADAIAMDLMGKSARDLNPLIEVGSAGMKEYADEAKKVGYVLSTDDLRALNRVQDAMDRFKRSTEAGKNQLAVQFAPSLEKAIEKLTEFVSKAAQALQKTGIVKAFGAILECVTGILDPLQGMFDILAGNKGLLAYVADAFALIADTVDVISGLWFWSSPGSLQKVANALGFNGTSHQQQMQQSRLGNNYDPTTGTYYQTKQINYGNYQIDVANGDYSGSYADYIDYMQKKNGWNAGGSMNWRGGMTWVGENGPELMYVPQGATIKTAQESREIGGDTFNISISARDVKEFNDIVAIAKNARMTARRVMS